MSCRFKMLPFHILLLVLLMTSHGITIDTDHSYSQWSRVLNNDLPKFLTPKMIKDKIKKIQESVKDFNIDLVIPATTVHYYNSYIVDVSENGHSFTSSYRKCFEIPTGTFFQLGGQLDFNYLKEKFDLKKIFQSLHPWRIGDNLLTYRDGSPIDELLAKGSFINAPTEPIISHHVLKEYGMDEESCLTYSYNDSMFEKVKCDVPSDATALCVIHQNFITQISEQLDLIHSELMSLLDFLVLPTAQKTATLRENIVGLTSKDCKEDDPTPNNLSDLTKLQSLTSIKFPGNLLSIATTAVKEWDALKTIKGFFDKDKSLESIWHLTKSRGVFSPKGTKICLINEHFETWQKTNELTKELTDVNKQLDELKGEMDTISNGERLTTTHDLSPPHQASEIVESVRNDVNNLNQRVTTLETVSESLQTSQNSEKEARQKSSTDLMNLKGLVDGILDSSRNSESSSSLGQLHQEVEAVNTRLTTLQQRFEKSESQISDLKETTEKIQQSQSESSTSTREDHVLSEKFAKLRQDLDETNRRNTQLSNSLGDIQKHSDLSADLTQLRRDFDEANVQINTIREDLKTIQESRPHETFQGQLHTLKRQIENIQSSSSTSGNVFSVESIPENSPEDTLFFTTLKKYIPDIFQDGTFDTKVDDKLRYYAKTTDIPSAYRPPSFMSTFKSNIEPIFNDKDFTSRLVSRIKSHSQQITINDEQEAQDTINLTNVIKQILNVNPIPSSFANKIMNLVNARLVDTESTFGSNLREIWKNNHHSEENVNPELLAVTLSIVAIGLSIINTIIPWVTWCCNGKFRNKNSTSDSTFKEFQLINQEAQSSPKELLNLLTEQPQKVQTKNRAFTTSRFYKRLTHFLACECCTKTLEPIQNKVEEPPTAQPPTSSQPASSNPHVGSPTHNLFSHSQDKNQRDNTLTSEKRIKKEAEAKVEMHREHVIDDPNLQDNIPFFANIGKPPPYEWSKGEELMSTKKFANNKPLKVDGTTFTVDEGQIHVPLGYWNPSQTKTNDPQLTADRATLDHEKVSAYYKAARLNKAIQFARYAEQEGIGFPNLPPHLHNLAKDLRFRIVVASNMPCMDNEQLEAKAKTFESIDELALENGIPNFIGNLMFYSDPRQKPNAADSISVGAGINQRTSPQAEALIQSPQPTGYLHPMVAATYDETTDLYHPVNPKGEQLLVFRQPKPILKKVSARKKVNLTRPIATQPVPLMQVALPGRKMYKPHANDFKTGARKKERDIRRYDTPEDIPVEDTLPNLHGRKHGRKTTQ